MLAFLDKISLGTPRLRRIIFWLISSFIAYVIIGFFVIPPILKTVLVDQGTDALGRHTSVEMVAFNPLTLRIEVQGIKVDKREGEGQLLSIGSFSASPGIASIWRLAPVISYLHLRDLAIDITFFGDGVYSISDLFGSKAKPTPQQSAVDAHEEKPGTVFPFALYGFEMTNATIVFDDRPHEKRHVISNLDLLVPFTSSFMSLRKEFTQPKFTAVVNGDPIELKGRTLPFDDTLRTEFNLGAVDVDLHQYWTYLPVETPLQLVNGRFTSDISLIFERPDAQRLTLFIDGGGKLTDLELAAPEEGMVLSLKELGFEMEKFSLGDNEMVLTNVIFDQPYFKVIRHKDNAINWPGYFPGSEVAKEGAKVKGVADESAPLLLDIRSIEVRGGALEWLDRAVPGGFSRTYPQFSLKATEVSTYGDRPSSFEMSIGKTGIVTANGLVTMEPFGAKAKITATDFDVLAYKPYFAQFVPLEIDSGMAGASADVDFTMEKNAFNLLLNDGTVTVDKLALRKPKAKNPSISLTRLAVSGTSVNLNGKSVEVGEVRLTGPTVRLERNKVGEIDLVRLFAGEEKPAELTPLKPVEPTVPVAGQPTQWTATIKAVRMVEGAATIKDFSIKHRADLSFDGLKMDLDNVTTKKGETATYAVSTRWGGRGSIELTGKADLDSLKGSGRLNVRGMGLRPFDGHMGEFTELLFASGAASADLAYVFSGGETPTFTVTGHAALTKVQLKDDQGDGEFAGIDAFKLAGIRFANEPYRLSIADIHLDGPRVVIDYDEKGRLNLRRAFRIPEPPPATEQDKAKEEQKKPAATETASTEPKPEKSFFDAIDIGKVTMENGRVSFRDATVRPVYSTTISDMKLGLIEIAKTRDARPKLDFSAKIGPTPMSITGVLNPVVQPIYSDLAIAVSGMELVPLTPYTIQYLAYPVEKGRLYADVSFKTEKQELIAENKFFIEQLVLGPKDKRPDAPNVPVKFGLSLMQDRKGDVELNLPIRGRLDDPDFRIGGIVFKAIASLFVKALASPFTLIGSIFGGGGENMDFVVFEPGRHELDTAGLKKIDTTIKALKERERLKLEVDGVIDPVVDKSGLVEVIFENKIKQQKYESLSRTERAQTTVDDMVIAPEEYEKFLFEAYKDEPDEEDIKPTTLFATDKQPVEFMEKFIIDRIVVDQQDLEELAVRRANAVKSHIIEKEASLTDRVFLLDRREDKAGKTGVPKHRVDLGIK